MSENIEALRAELARVRRPHRFWASVVTVLGAAFLGEVGLVVAQNATLHRPQIVMKTQPEPQPMAQPQLEPQPIAQPQPQPPPQPQLQPSPQPRPKPRPVLDVTAPICPPSDPLCGMKS
jgi:hypothetical protein